VARFTAALLATTALAAPTAPALADMQAGRLQGLPSVERLVNAARGNGDKPIDFTLPLMRAAGNTVYLNLRTQGGGDAMMDGDVGVGFTGSTYRQIAVGGYALGVIEHSAEGLAPRQVTFGGEAANDWLRLNGNVCLPQTTCIAVAPPTPKGGSLADRSVLGVSATALDVGGINPTGLDAELSLHLRHPAKLPGDWRLAAGASHVLDSVAGLEAAVPRGRLEVTFDQALDAAGIKGARLVVGGEMHRDETEGAVTVVSARLNIPLYGGGAH
jgi:hypothetical protein